MHARKLAVGVAAATALTVLLGSGPAQADLGFDTVPAGTVSAAGSLAAGATFDTAPLPNRSGLPWASGVYIPGSSPAQTEAFAAWRGRPVDVVVDWSARQTWSDIISPTWLYDAWAGTPYTKVIGVAPIPEGDNSTLAACAAGDYDAKWVEFGNTIKAAGLDSQTIIRLGWEFNGDWYKWAATQPMTFRGCWIKIYDAVESVAPALRWEWTVNRGPGQAVRDAREAYPGDAYVDYVGVDSYDAWPAVTDKATWWLQDIQPLGLSFWANFAKVHHKQVNFPEWGVYPGPGGTGHNGGDNAYYIANMETYFKSLGNLIGYESYFNESASYYGGSIFAPVQNPKASAEYLKDVHP